MPRFNVEVDGQWACFSSIVDVFITPFMDKEEYEAWRHKEYGCHIEPAEKCNRKSLADCIRDIGLNRSDEEICDELRSVGLLYEREEEEDD